MSAAKRIWSIEWRVADWYRRIWLVVCMRALIAPNKSISMPFNRQRFEIRCTQSQLLPKWRFGCFRSNLCLWFVSIISHISFDGEPIYIFGKLCLNDCCRYMQNANMMRQESNATLKWKRMCCVFFPFKKIRLPPNRLFHHFRIMISALNWWKPSDANANDRINDHFLSNLQFFFSFRFLVFADMDFGGFPHDWAIGWLASSVAEAEAIGINQSRLLCNFGRNNYKPFQTETNENCKR